MNTLLRMLFFHVLVQFIVKVILGVHVRHIERIPREGACVIVANHNSHLDTMVIMCLLLKQLNRVQPVAAMDYFLRNKILAWFSLKIIGILPITRKPTQGEDVLKPIFEALKKQNILVLYPEGSRGEPEKFQKLKTGISRISEQMPHVPIVPIYFYGLGKALPKGESLIVPFFCDAYVGEALFWTGSRTAFMDDLQNSFNELVKESNSKFYEY
jgi:1-acyl-sn-glycerol-3-phosphate acyltransferase